MPIGHSCSYTDVSCNQKVHSSKWEPFLVFLVDMGHQSSDLISPQAHMKFTLTIILGLCFFVCDCFFICRLKVADISYDVYDVFIPSGFPPTSAFVNSSLFMFFIMNNNNNNRNNNTYRYAFTCAHTHVHTNTHVHTYTLTHLLK